MDTRLCCFYNSLDPRTKGALELWAPRSGLEVEWVDTSATQHTYAEELERRWAVSDLILVEQDKEIHSECFPEFLFCDEPWCSYAYWIYPEPHTSLCIGGFGVTKFTRQIQQQIPVSLFAGDQQLGIDRRFYDTAMTLGIGCHLHGYVLHHHVYDPRPAPVREYVAAGRANGTLPPACAPPAPAPHLLPGSYDLTASG